ncbi:MAG: DUF2851 family protein [bacterium]|nr:DUF2851 family protein [bacterium]
MQEILNERAYQRRVHAMLSDPATTWTCTNGDVIQIVAAGLINVHDGPDFRDMCVLHKGIIHVGNGEFHVRASDYGAHDHAIDMRYASLLLHIVFTNDAPPVDDARWTLCIPVPSKPALAKNVSASTDPSESPLPELQHHALLRLLRNTAEAQQHMRRIGVRGATIAMATAWLDRLSRKRHRPMHAEVLVGLRDGVATSPIGLLAEDFSMCHADDVLGAINAAEHRSIAREGAAMRRELFVNAVLPVCCALARDDQRIPLLHWYWSARSVHPYGHLRRRFPDLAQLYVWQQQAMLEYLRHHGTRTTVCADIIHSYGLEHTLRFLRLVEE